MFKMFISVSQSPRQCPDFNPLFACPSLCPRLIVYHCLFFQMSRLSDYLYHKHTIH